MAVLRVSIDTPNPTAADQGALLEVANSRTGLVDLGEFLMSVGTGGRTGKVRLNTGAVQAEGKIVFSSFVADDTVTINGSVFTGKANPSGAAQFAVGSVDQDVANNLVAKINASATDLIVGVVHAYRRASILFSAIVDGDTITVNGVVFTAKTAPDASDPKQFAVLGTQAKTAQAFINAVNAVKNREKHAFQLGNALLSISLSTATVTIDYDGTLTVANSAHATVTSTTVVFRCLIGGQIGNLMTVAVSAHGTATSPSGGTEGTETIYANSRSIL